MKAYFQHLQWVIQAQARITAAENKVRGRDQRIEELRREVTDLQAQLHQSHKEKRQLLEQYAAPLERICTAHPEIQE